MVHNESSKKKMKIFKIDEAMKLIEESQEKSLINLSFKSTQEKKLCLTVCNNK